MLIVSHESRRLFALRDADRNDLLTKAPGGDSSRRFALGAGGEGVLALAADVEGVGEVLGGNAHVVVVKGVPQAVLDHAVLQAGVAETQAVAGAMHQIGSIAHTLLAAGDNDPGVAAADRLHRLLNRFQSGAAHQIDGDRRSVDRQAGPQRGLARRVLPAAGGKHLAEN